MRRLFSFNMITLDGLFEGQDHNIGWHNVDAEFNEFAIAQLNEIGTLLFGRITYQMMASYWPTSEAVKNDPVVADLMNRLPKIVVSKTMAIAEWNNTSLIKDQIASEILKLKKQSGQDLAIFGSANLISTLMRMDLIDEHRVMVNPVILGTGTPLFQPKDKFNLRLLRTRAFGNGNVLLCYESKRK